MKTPKILTGPNWGFSDFGSHLANFEFGAEVQSNQCDPAPSWDAGMVVFSKSILGVKAI